MTFFRGRAACFALMFTSLLCVLRLPAQVSRWNELNAQGKELYRQGRFAEAISVATEALHVAEATFGPENPWVGTALNNLAVYNMVEGNYAAAEPLYQRALGIHENALGPNNPAVAQDLNNVASLYEKQGKYDAAEPLFERALSIDENWYGPDNAAVASDLGNLAGLYEDEGRYAEADPLCQRSRNIWEKVSGPASPDFAQALDNLAVLYDDQGKYAQAEPLFERALSIDENALGPDHPAVADDLNNLAELYRTQGKYAEAEPRYQRALSIAEKVYGPEDFHVAVVLNNLALLYDRQGKYSEAEPRYKHALSIWEDKLGPDHPDVANALNNLALLCVHQSKYAEAEPLFQRALKIYEKALGPDHPLVALDLNNLAAVYRQQGKYAEAEPLLQRALGIAEKALGADHPSVAIDLTNLALLYFDQSKYAEAEPYYNRTFDNLFQQFQYNFNYMTEKERLGFLDTVSYNFPIYFSFVHSFRQKDPALVGSMYNLLLWEKGFVAASIANLRRQVEASGDAEALNLLNQLTTKRTQLAALLNANPPDRDLWRKQIDQLRTEASDIEKALVARSSVFAEQKKLDRATWQQVRDSLKPGEAAVEFAHFEFYDKKWTGTYYYVALVVTHESKDQPEYIFLGDDKQIEGDALARFQQSTQARGFGQKQQATLPGANAYDLIWKPLEAALAGKTRIYLSTDGVLNTIPLGIIPAADGKLLMERYDLRLVSSTKDILRAAAKPGAATALLVGDPLFDLSEAQLLAAIEKLALPQPEAHVPMAALEPNDRSRDLGNGGPLPQLPGTGAEVNGIAELMKRNGWKANVYTRDLALKRVVEQATSPRVVHLATHGFFLPDEQINTDPMTPSDTQTSGMEDPMLRSGLFFAGADRALARKPTPEGLDNGVLTAMEAGNLNLTGTELVVLSACDSGQGKQENGEGVFGLRRALREAGAQNVMMSLWSVPDQETLELMKLFYSKWLAGTEKHEALKQAQLEMRERVRRSHGHDLPYYWGAFVLLGR